MLFVLEVCVRVVIWSHKSGKSGRYDGEAQFQGKVSFLDLFICKALSRILLVMPLGSTQPALIIVKTQQSQLSLLQSRHSHHSPVTRISWKPKPHSPQLEYRDYVIHTATLLSYTRS